MGITLSTIGGLFGPLQGLMGWLVPREQRVEPMLRGRPAAGQASVARPRAARPVAGPASRPIAPVRPCERTRRPLRVVRVLEGAGATASAGRMFMSGRMADVCAELDRLAALEAG